MASRKVGVSPNKKIPVVRVDNQPGAKQKLTKLEKQARREASQSIRVASAGGFGTSSNGSIKDADSNFYSPQLSTDFLELPQSEREKRELFRFWYTTHPVVGSAIDFHCFPPGAPVMMRDGTTLPIESLRVGDEVINGLGEPTRVLNTFRDKVCGPIVRLKVRGIQENIDCTENHPFLVYRASEIDCKYPKRGMGACKSGRKSTCKQKNCSGLGFGKPQFVFAKDLRDGDYICSPSMKSSNSVFNRDQLRLLGYYAAEGSLSYTKRGKPDRVVFSLNSNEYETIASEIEQSFKEEYGNVARKRIKSDCNACEVRCYKRKLADFCLEHVGCGSHDKRLSLDIIDSPREDILEFLGAYWNGDGSLTKNGYVATTVSEQLARQVYALALKVGYSPTLHTVEPKDRKSGFKSLGNTYRVLIPYRVYPEFSKYANFVRNGYGADSTREYQIRIGSNSLRRIEKTETISYDGFVYNIEVDGAGDRKSYIAYGLATHNTDIPLSKIRLSPPKGSDEKKNKRILHFYEQMCNRVRLFQTLYDVTHEYWLQGVVYIFAEDHDLTDLIPPELLVDETEEEVGEIDYVGRPIVRKEKVVTPKSEAAREAAIKKFTEDNYKGWQRLQILPPEQVKLEVFQYTNKTRMELIPSEKDRQLVQRAESGTDVQSERIAEDIPREIRESLVNGNSIPLNTSPYDEFLCSSFCYYLAHKRSSYDDRGVSLLERCHLPGTEITILRDGQVLQEPIETLDPETDMILGGSGLWREFDLGTRPVSEPVSEINIEKTLGTIKLTSDHGMRVLRNGVHLDVKAADVQVGDYVPSSRVILEKTIDSIDLSDFVRGLPSCSYTGRKSGHSSSLSLEVLDETDNSFCVKYVKSETDPRKTGYFEKLDAVLEWISGLSEPTTVSGPEFFSRFGLRPSYKTKIRHDLAKFGASIKVERIGKRYLTTFYPLPTVVPVDRSRNTIKTFNKHLALDGNLGYLIGYWLGDGWIRRNGTTLDYGQFGICYSSKSPRSCASSEHLKASLDAIGVKWAETAPSDMIHISGYNDIFTRWIAENFGHTKDDKHLPSWVFNTSEDFLFGVLRGLVDSDGCVTVKKTGVTTVQIAMSTKPLVDQVVLVMQSLEIPVSMHLHKSRDTTMPNGSITESCRPLWQAAFSDTESVSRFMDSGFLAKRVDVRIPKNPGWGCKHKLIDGVIHYRVKSVNSEQYDGPVYSLNVDEDHSFYANRIWQANCLRTLLFQDKLRQAQTSIASRAMTPKRVVWGDKMSELDVDNLRDQVDQALIDPDFTIVTNFEIHWDEIGARDRLLDLSAEYENTNKMLYIGLRITESMLTGEASYSGERIHLDVMNTMYLLYRETLVDYVENYLFAPVAEKKGFYEIDENGDKHLLFPKLQFTRLALRDNSELQDFMFNLYQKGSLPISFILELLNIDSDETMAQLKKDMFTPNDSTFNEFLRNALGSAGDSAVEKTDILEKIAKSIGLKIKSEDGDRFGE
jgi:intein/homing endonuclease